MNAIIENKLYKNRIIRLTGGIDPIVAEDIISQLLYHESNNRNLPIYLYINSGGGDVSSGLAIADTIRLISCPVYTICVGICASMGAFLLSCGAKGNRYALENSTIMIHQLSSMSGCGNMQVSDLVIQAKYSQRLKNRMTQLMALNTGQSSRVIEEYTDRDTFLNPRQAIEFGIVDYIL